MIVLKARVFFEYDEADRLVQEKPAIGAKTYDKRLVDMELNPNGVMAQTLPSSLRCV